MVYLILKEHLLNTSTVSYDNLLVIKPVIANWQDRRYRRLQSVLSLALNLHGCDLQG